MRQRFHMLGRRLLFASFIMLILYLFMLLDGQEVHLVEWILLACILGVSFSVVALARGMKRKAEEDKAILVPADANGVLGRQLRALENICFLYASVFREMNHENKEHPVVIPYSGTISETEWEELQELRLQQWEERMVLSGQMRDLGRMICRQRLELGGHRKLYVDESLLRKGMKKNGVILNSGVYMENRWGRKEVTLDITIQKGHRVTIIHLTEALSEILECHMVCDSEAVILAPLTRRQLVFYQGAELSVTHVVSRGERGAREISGDSFSCFQVGEGCVLVGLCDGMGMGERAAKESGRAMEIAEQMAEAGFSTADLLTGLHRILILEGNVHPLAMDIGKIDLYEGKIELLKAGSAMTIRKHGPQVEVLRSSSSPIGVLKENKAEANIFDLEAGDILLFMTDGITEAGVDEEEICAYAAQCNPDSLREFTEDILYYININGKASDDQTILAVQVLEAEISR